ncbi:hypothetical protein KM924_23125 [Brevibacillus parabrevis]|uniref:hypothetical protein n=1 Tax=Brevibacillus parabrevis TaxID=54914 RepID=UPI001C2106E2|nr:hypothetical protein [Brevibacillus parabrevis]MBU8715398.1 hypothetical protein [Brevibacillus parabrevis]
MAKYTSRFVELGFYVNETRRQFNGGRYVTEDPKEITVLDALVDVERVDEPEKSEPKPEEPEAAAKPARKSSAK